MKLILASVGVSYTRVMALFIRQEEDISALRTKVTAELQERMKKTAQTEADDISKHSTALKGQHQTRSAGIVITIVVIILAGLVLYALRPR